MRTYGAEIRAMQDRKPFAYRGTGLIRGAAIAIMPHMSTIPTEGSIAERGSRIYEERLREILEPQHNGKYVVIDVETGEYELDKDHLAVSDRAAAKRPGAPLFATRVGSRTLGRVGGRWAKTVEWQSIDLPSIGRSSIISI